MVTFRVSYRKADNSQKVIYFQIFNNFISKQNSSPGMYRSWSSLSKNLSKFFRFESSLRVLSRTLPSIPSTIRPDASFRVLFLKSAYFSEFVSFNHRTNGRTKVRLWIRGEVDLNIQKILKIWNKIHAL